MATTLSARLLAAEDQIDAAYALHDSLYACSPEERASRMQAARDHVLELVTSLEADGMAEEADGGSELQAKLLYLRGKAIACAEDGQSDDEAERLLADAVKLDPTLIGAWNCLGECFWQRGELETARHTFLGALGECVCARLHSDPHTVLHPAALQPPMRPLRTR